MKAAANVFDDIEDADNAESVPAKYGIALASNAASVLVVLAEKGITRLKDSGVKSDTVVKLIDTVNSYYAKACIGQHLDLSLMPEERTQEGAYLKLIGMKSAFAAECACYTGALLAGADQGLINLFTTFGYNLGMAAQIANDIRDITGLRDINNRKITLSVIFALGQADEARELLKSAFFKNKGEFKIAPGQIKDLKYERILTDIWGFEYRDEKKLVHAIVRRLREKIEAHPKQPSYIIAISGVGYRFKEIP
jgi:geranylgeranyl pyrophosphate synthase